MSMSLRDQLLKAGLVNEKQAKQAVKQKQKQTRMEHRGQTEKDRSQELAVQQAQAEKLAKDQELNRAQEEKKKRKAEQAQIKQLIETSRLPKLSTEDYYNFVDDKKVKRLSVNVMMRDKLSKGSLAIVRYEGRYEVVPRATAERIQERDPKRVVLLNVQSGEPDPDDPYAAYQVPDDLMW
ncbi:MULTISPECIES: DUF2058 domain-containing protein [Pseudomonas]|uniref:Nucleoprotein/polynucleotide-associated enzyme n=2 Tax=Pseudomonas TaxID=286 RepID=A0A178LEZ6_9PSED|nr:MULTISPECIES: DUF2058 domain-containing protein [Pseudomonas]MCD4863118.1 DUF2058 domain-containing protein [Pseudomonas sp. PLB05]MDC7828358.1 DUF2058 domain-containing protein [Pseudomonas benzopyrenica]MXS20037.1 DUF2058 family protein [Pseudomonas oryzihabitans]NRH43143.1 DUF2058 domain-containing protein [Pseudomonas sp. MS15a(2019)]OAN28266.1 nucleoprotein/polynucleotide-associated enzyme [Pseudomonas oryzihabitans]